MEERGTEEREEGSKKQKVKMQIEGWKRKTRERKKKGGGGNKKIK